MTLMGCYDDFWEITCCTLDMTLAEYDLADNQVDKRAVARPLFRP